jgi:hypothetical protein
MCRAKTANEKGPPWRASKKFFADQPMRAALRKTGELDAAGEVARRVRSRRRGRPR